MESLQKKLPAPSFTLKSCFGFRVVISVLLDTTETSAWDKSLPLPAARLNLRVRPTNAKVTSWQTLQNKGEEGKSP